jgi:hypothetical protein
VLRSLRAGAVCEVRRALRHVRRSGRDVQLVWSWHGGRQSELSHVQRVWACGHSRDAEALSSQLAGVAALLPAVNEHVEFADAYVVEFRAFVDWHHSDYGRDFALDITAPLKHIRDSPIQGRWLPRMARRGLKMNTEEMDGLLSRFRADPCSLVNFIRDAECHSDNEIASAIICIAHDAVSAGVSIQSAAETRRVAGHPIYSQYASAHVAAIAYKLLLGPCEYQRNAVWGKPSGE